KQKLTVLYGSQTGQAEEIATQIHEDAVFNGYDVDLHCLKDAGKKFDISQITCAVFVCSTTGDGDPPENARKFLRTLSRKTLSKDHLSHLKYALLGLGDSNYSTFCGGPKKLERVLINLGAKQIHHSGFADDGTDMELVVEPWLEELWPALKKYFSNQDCEILNDKPEENSTKDENSDFAKLDKNVDCGQNKSVENLSKEIKNIEIMVTYKSKNDINTTTLQKSILLQESSLSLVELTLPPLFPLYLETFASNEVRPAIQHYQNDCPFPIASGSRTSGLIRKASVLTREDAVKRTIEICMEVENREQYMPGDAIAVCCKNPAQEVEWLINRLDLNEKADESLQLKVSVEAKKKSVPSFIPNIFTIREVFTSCLDIRAVVKKPLLRCLVEFTSDPGEKRQLEELCSRQGGDEYMKRIRENFISIIDIIAAFQSCKPTLEVLLQHLPRLQPRRYSVANYGSEFISFVFNVVHFPNEPSHLPDRKGICTGYLESLVEPMIKQKQVDPISISIFPTKSNDFALPGNLKTPIVMIGPGTGVSPFIGFLQQRREQIHSRTACNIGPAWLFFGCRHKERDFLFQSELESFIDGVLTKLCVAFSRDKVTENEPKYVQDSLTLHKNDIVKLLLEDKAVFFVCGDARNMAKDVRNCLINLIAIETNCDEDAAREKFSVVLAEKRYKEDIWT
uniref:Methionine synthase reductase n=1 Tax=Ciona savignyi TaxID=51511 RepID=H2YB52_CIOSA